MSPSNNLKGRNYFQALDSDGIFAIARLNDTYNGVQSGTNVAIKFGINLKREIYVYDYYVKKWYKYSYKHNKFTEYNDIPILTEHFAGIGIRKCQYYRGCKDYLGKDIENEIKNQIRLLYENA